MAPRCNIERCNNKGSFELPDHEWRLCAKHEKEWRGGGMRLRANTEKRTLRLVEVMVSDY